ncbi:hypothetical protein HJG60_012078 [Phyllostomus discolor]|uniref:Uncharacterized protein n=1 Tax=Phyllostomus discolor TaxID=89673 RepID=A0A834DWC9_9CHIR|nr:hypothetical protein HJG60_012078 [Phyllostomus discolor]
MQGGRVAARPRCRRRPYLHLTRGHPGPPPPSAPNTPPPSCLPPAPTLRRRAAAPPWARPTRADVSARWPGWNAPPCYGHLLGCLDLGAPKRGLVRAWPCPRGGYCSLIGLRRCPSRLPQQGAAAASAHLRWIS